MTVTDQNYIYEVEVLCYGSILWTIGNKISTEIQLEK